MAWLTHNIIKNDDKLTCDGLICIHLQYVLWLLFHMQLTLSKPLIIVFIPMPFSNVRDPRSQLPNQITYSLRVSAVLYHGSKNSNRILGRVIRINLSDVYKAMWQCDLMTVFLDESLKEFFKTPYEKNYKVVDLISVFNANVFNFWLFKSINLALYPK